MGPAKSDPEGSGLSSLLQLNWKLPAKYSIVKIVGGVR